MRIFAEHPLSEFFEQRCQAVVREIQSQPQDRLVAPIFDVIAKGTPQHPCFIRLESALAESWMQYEFKLPSDPSRNVHLAVLSFHFPSGPRRPKPLVAEPQFPIRKPPPRG